MHICLIFLKDDSLFCRIVKVEHCKDTSVIIRVGIELFWRNGVIGHEELLVIADEHYKD